MRLHSLLADEERMGNVFVCTPRSETPQDRLLPRSQYPFRRAVRVFPADIGESFSSQQSGDQLSLDPHIPLVDPPNRLPEIGNARVLRDVSLRPRPEGRDNHRLIPGSGEEEQLGLGALLGDRPDELNAVYLRRADVEEDDVRLEVLNAIDRLEPVAGFAHDLDVLLTVEADAERFTNKPLF